MAVDALRHIGPDAERAQAMMDAQRRGAVKTDRPRLEVAQPRPETLFESTSTNRIKEHFKKWGVQNPDAVRFPPPPGETIGFVNYGATAEMYRHKQAETVVKREE